ncbi:uncharacterized protein KY384_001339 [Bacidia gigantensis]|uniref:uncharacterized protein n=1 Tax=Bacidia gigantensis TaxID=2732470 RepID=UPI001D03759A|nr:uncharacterized protein KY384_001339 [Bacidia gigantensis]KAG8533599.1 hypothetical protein KY384_001339 [Bacidia gigantensis]
MAAMISGNEEVSKHVVSPAKVSVTTFITVIWVCAVFAITFSIARIAVRFQAFRRLYADDWLVLFALVALLANTTLWQVGRHIMYETINIFSGQVLQPRPGFEQRIEKWMHINVAAILLFYSGLWAVKLSFLAFFRRMGSKVRNQKAVWNAVTGITVAAYIVCVAIYPYKCQTSNLTYVIGEMYRPSAIAYYKNVLKVSLAMDVVTDALSMSRHSLELTETDACVIVMAVPINIFWMVQINLRQKVAIASVFLITIIIVIFAIIRVTLINSASYQIDMSWLHLWTSIEQTISIIVACLVSFRALFTKSGHRLRAMKHSGERSYSWPFSRMTSFFSRTSTRGSSSSEASQEILQRTEHSLLKRHGSTIHAYASKEPPWYPRSPAFETPDFAEKLILPPNAVHVRRDVSVV